MALDLSNFEWTPSFDLLINTRVIAEYCKILATGAILWRLGREDVVPYNVWFFLIHNNKICSGNPPIEMDVWLSLPSPAHRQHAIIGMR
jgi:hypothetical protein